jgi:hypothetical protein
MAIEKQADSKNKEMEIIRSNTPTSFTDYVRVGGMTEGQIIMQLLSLTPDCIHENHRTVIASDHVKELIDSLCELSEYYPKKPRKQIKKRAPIKTSK